MPFGHTEETGRKVLADQCSNIERLHKKNQGVYQIQERPVQLQHVSIVLLY